MPRKSNPPSRVIQWLDLAWDSINTGTAHSWERVNHGMHGALRHAIIYGFEFELDDYAYICGNYGAWKWLGADGHDTFYHMAVVGGGGKHTNSAKRTNHNLSAIRSIEAYLNRDAVNFQGARIPRWTVFHYWTEEQREAIRDRVVKSPKPIDSLGRILREGWGGTKVRVSSISQEGEETVWRACQYENWRGEHPIGQPNFIHRLVAEDFRAMDRWFRGKWIRQGENPA